MTEDTRCSVCRADYPQTGMRTGPAFELVGPGFRVCKRCRGAGKDARRKWEAESGASGAGGAATPPEQLTAPSERRVWSAAHGAHFSTTKSPAGAGEAERLAAEERYAFVLQRLPIAAHVYLGADEADQRHAYMVGAADAMHELGQALAEKDAALGRVQALVEQWRLADIDGHPHDPAIAFAEAQVQCADELAAALRGEVQP